MNINSWNSEFILGWLAESRRHKSYEINNNSDDDIEQLKISKTKVDKPLIEQLTAEQPKVEQPKIEQPKDNQSKYSLRDDNLPVVNPVASTDDLEPANQKKYIISGISVSKYTRKVISYSLGACLVIYMVFSIFHMRDLTNYLSAPEDVFLKKAGREHRLCVELDGKVPQYADGAAIDVYGYDGVYTVYIDNEYEGIHITDARYSIYDIKIGKNFYFENQKMSYEYDYKDWVYPFDDSTRCYFLANSANNDCLFICMDKINDDVVSVTYYKDYNKAAEKLKTY